MARALRGDGSRSARHNRGRPERRRGDPAAGRAWPERAAGLRPNLCVEPPARAVEERPDPDPHGRGRPLCAAGPRPGSRRHRRHPAVRSGSGLRPGVSGRARDRGTAPDGRPCRNRSAGWRGGGRRGARSGAGRRGSPGSGHPGARGRAGPRGGQPESRGSSPDRRVAAGEEDHGCPDRRRSGRGRPQQHGLRRYVRQLWPRIGGRRSHRHGDGVRGDRAPVAGRGEPAHAPAAEPRPGGPPPGPRRPGGRRADRGARPRPRAIAVGHGDLRDRTGRRGGARGASRRGHHLAGPWCATNGQAQRPGAAVVCRGNARERVRHRLRQDRHAHQGRDDRPADLRGRTRAGRDGRRLRGRRSVSRSRCARLPSTGGDDAARRSRARLRRQDQATPRHRPGHGGALVREGRPNGARSRRGGGQSGPAQARARRRLPAAR